MAREHEAISAFMPAANGGRRRMFTAAQFAVTVEPHEDDAAQAKFTEQLARSCGALPAPERQRVLGPVYVRRIPGGQLWMLGKRESGLAAFGYPVESWAAMFAAWAVVPGEHGRDEHGEYWRLDPEVA